MAKKKSKKFEVYGSPISHPSKKIVKSSEKNKKKKAKITANSMTSDGPSSLSVFVPDVTITGVVATSSTIASDNEATLGRKKGKESVKQTSGFIFMCNGKTKPECYRNRVFGLPRGQLEVLEKIKPGSKLFLFDFDLKLLYGVYKATSEAKLGLEPTAFNGKFPAQVRFKIFKECLPLREKAFKHAIKDNYHGSKFRQDLTSKQVKTLSSLFLPITKPSSSTSASTLTNMIIPHTFPAQLPARLPLHSNLHFPVVHHGHSLPVPVLQAERLITHLPYDQHGSDTHLGRVQPHMEGRHTVQEAAVPHRSEPYYQREAHQSYLPDKPTLSVKDPYGRYGHTLEVIQRDRIAGCGSEHQTFQSTRKTEIVHHLDNVVDCYSQNLPSASASYLSSQTNAQAGMLSSYQPHYPVRSNEDLSQACGDHLQGSVSGRSSLVEANLSAHQHGKLLSSYQPHYSITRNEAACPTYADNLQRPVSGRSTMVEASLSSHAQGKLLSSYQPCYTITSTENISRAYTDPIQRPLSGSSGLVEANFSVSSCYSFPGAASTYR